MIDHERALVAFPDLRRLANRWVHGVGWRFIQREDDSGNVVMTAGFRAWLDGSMDVLTLTTRANARAWRTNSEGGMVWKREGELRQVIAETLKLPAPENPTAPRLVLTGPTPTHWTP